MSESALSKNRTHYEKGKVQAWACNPLSGSAESNPDERTAVDWLATIATSEGLARGPHPAAHPLPHSWPGSTRSADPGPAWALCIFN